jgi:CheY-like chemotaxis protein
MRPIDILLVEDSPGDVRLTREALRDGKVENRLTVARDGVEAMAYLRRECEFRDSPRPDLILLDLNLPRKDGREVLAEIKADQSLRTIPVAVLTASEEEHDVLRAYELEVAGYMTKPVDIAQLIALVQEIDTLRISIVTLVAV